MFNPDELKENITLEQSLIWNSLTEKSKAGQMLYRENRFVYRTGRIPAFVFGIAFVVLGGIGLLIFKEEKILEAISEAFLVAGILCVSVDPFLKRQLLREVDQELFVHMIGYDLPLPIKERIKKIVFGIKLYAVDKRITCTISSKDENYVLVKVTETYDLVNPTPIDQKYIAWAAFEKVENPQYCRVRGSGKITCQADTLKESSEDLGILKVTADEVSIPPTLDESNCHFLKEYELILPKEHYLNLYQIIPVIRIWIYVNAPNFTIQSTCQDRYENVYPDLFMSGEQLTIRWKPTTTDNAK